MKKPNHRVVICVRRDLYYPFEVMGIHLTVLKVVACLAWCRGKTFPSPSKYCLTILMTFKIPNITWAVGHSFNLYIGLQGPGWLYMLGIPPRADVPLWTPRARATDLGQGPNLRAGSGRAPCVPRSREHEKRPAAGREKNAKVPEKHNLYIVIVVVIYT